MVIVATGQRPWGSTVKKGYISASGCVQPLKWCRTALTRTEGTGSTAARSTLPTSTFSPYRLGSSSYHRLMHMQMQHIYGISAPTILNAAYTAMNMMCPFVCINILRLSKRLTTHTTPEWLLTCTNTFVSVCHFPAIFSFISTSQQKCMSSGLYTV